MFLFSGYQAQTEDYDPWFSDNGCTSAGTNIYDTWTYTQDGTVTSRTSAKGINAKALYIKWASSDLITHTSTHTEADKSTSTAEPDTTSRQTSKAWIAGPVIGSIAALAMIMFIVVWCARKSSKRQSSGNAPYTYDSAQQVFVTPNIQSKSNQASEWVDEGTQFHELSAPRKTHELP